MTSLGSDAKSVAKAILPANMASFIRGCRYRGFVAHIKYVLKLKKYRRQFSKANAAAADSVVVLPQDCRIQIIPEVREAFEHFGWRDPDMVDEFIGFMKVASRAKIFWDVGALYGTFSLAFTLAGKDRQALAFEPNPVSRAKLKVCLTLNPSAKVEVYDFALGVNGEQVEFERGFHFTAVSGLSARPDKKDVVQLKTVSIDELIERNFAPPDMIKIDVEGQEFEVLKGAKKFLFAKKPLLSIELHPGLLNHKGTSALAIAQYLEQAGYTFHDMHLKPVKKEYFERRDNFRTIAM